MIALSTACSVLNVELHHRDPCKPLPKWLNNYIINKLGNYVHGSYQVIEIQHKEQDIGKESPDIDDSIKELIGKEDIACQLLYKIYTVLATSKVQDEEQTSDVKEATHWKRASRTMDLVFVLLFMAMFLVIHTVLPLLFKYAQN